MMRLRFKLLMASGLLAFATPVSAHNIVIGNDDGLTANVKALYDALKAKGHDVIVAVPCQQGSGMGGAVQMMKPFQPLKTDCLHGAAKAGDPGAGPMTAAGFENDFYYVDSTPVVAMLYGLDVVAPARWGKAPDLILSGPNIGRNAGPIVVSSGTVSNAQYGMMRGIASIALSAGMNSHSENILANPLSQQIAERSVTLVQALIAGAEDGPLLPAGIGLNVNFPDQLDGAVWKSAQIGSLSDYDARFVDDLPKVMGKAKAGSPPLPGLYFRVLEGRAEMGLEKDEAAVSRENISVSVMQVAYDVPEPQRALAEDMASLLNSSKEN